MRPLYGSKVWISWKLIQSLSQLLLFPSAALFRFPELTLLHPSLFPGQRAEYER